MSSSEKIASKVFFRFSPLLWEIPFALCLTETLGSSFVGGFDGSGLEGMGSAGFFGLAGVLEPTPLTGPLSCVPLPIFSFIVGRVPAAGVDLLPGMDIVCPFGPGSLSLPVFTAGVTGGRGGGGMEGCAFLCDSRVLLIRAHSNQGVSDRENEG